MIGPQRCCAKKTPATKSEKCSSGDMHGDAEIPPGDADTQTVQIVQNA